MVEIDGRKIFYREAGPANAPDRAHASRFSVLIADVGVFAAPSRRQVSLIAHEYPGNSSAPSPSDFKYTFDNLARVTTELTAKLGITHYVLFMQDYGGPVGLRMALAHPERVIDRLPGAVSAPLCVAVAAANTRFPFSAQSFRACSPWSL